MHTLAEAKTVESFEATDTDLPEMGGKREMGWGQQGGLGSLQWARAPHLPPPWGLPVANSDSLNCLGTQVRTSWVLGS